MPTTRKRVSRRGTVPADVSALFMVGCGRNSIDDKTFMALWQEHGETFCKQNPDDAQTCWAVAVEGLKPNV